MYKVYLAGDLFDHKHIAGNLLLAQEIKRQSQGLYSCMLPQDWEASFSNTIDIRNRDIQMVMRSDLVLFNFDGPDLDAGTVVEFMVAKMLDIPSVLLRTDFRSGGCFNEGDWNLMATGFPRSAIVKKVAIEMYNSLGLEKMHQDMAKSIISAFEKVKKEDALLDSYEKIFAAYKHVTKMCGAGLESILSEKRLHEIIAAKIEKNVYSSGVISSDGNLSAEKRIIS